MFRCVFPFHSSFQFHLATGNFDLFKLLQQQKEFDDDKSVQIKSLILSVVNVLSVVLFYGLFFVLISFSSVFFVK